jgi:hypothetical protein
VPRASTRWPIRSSRSRAALSPSRSTSTSHRCTGRSPTNVTRPATCTRRIPVQELVAGLIADCGYEPILLGGLDQARLLEDHSALAFAVYQAGMGEFFYRMAPPGQL